MQSVCIYRLSSYRAVNTSANMLILYKAKVLACSEINTKHTNTCTVIPRLTSDPANDFYG